jgi:hypothetical protein
MKIGDLSRELETAKNQYSRDTDVASKTETLEAAGINIRTAERYEEFEVDARPSQSFLTLLRRVRRRYAPLA